MEKSIIISIGTTVKLKSGGPLMTVTYYEGEAITCVWFANENDLQSDRFPLQSLNIID